MAQAQANPDAANAQQEEVVEEAAGQLDEAAQKAKDELQRTRRIVHPSARVSSAVTAWSWMAGAAGKGEGAARPGCDERVTHGTPHTSARRRR